MEAVRLETGFVYIKVVVVTAAESCGNRVKALFRALIYLCSAVGNAERAVGKNVRRSSHLYPPISHCAYQPGLPTQIVPISTVIHKLSPSGGKEGENGQNRFLGLFSLLLDAGGQLIDLVIDRAALSHELADLPVGMHHGGVIAAAKCLADLR